MTPVIPTAPGGNGPSYEYQNARLKTAGCDSLRWKIFVQAQPAGAVQHGPG